MRRTPELSDAGSAFLRQLDEIQAGEAALRNDIAAILAATAERLPAACRIEGDSLRREQPIRGRPVSVVLSMRWGGPDYREPARVPSVDVDAGEVALPALLAAPLSRLGSRLRAVDFARLIARPVATCVELWQEAWQEVAKLAAGDELQGRLLGWELMNQVSDLVVAKADSLTWRASLWRSAGTSSAPPQWPCQCGWTLTTGAGRPPVRWWIDLNPEGAALRLLCDGWEEIRDAFEKLPVDLSRGSPLVVSDLSSVYAKVLEGALDPRTAARQIVLRSLDRYQQVLAWHGLRV